MRFSTIAFAAFCGVAAAREMTLKQRQLALLQGILENVQQITQNLDSAINGWTGGDPSPIIKGSQELIAATKKGTEEANAAATITDNETLTIQKFVTGLQKVVAKTVDDLVAKKSAVSAANLGAETYSQLTQQLAGAQSLSTAITGKVPSKFAIVGKQLSDNIIAAVQKGVDAYADIKNQGTAAPVAAGGAAAAGAGAVGGAARVSNAPAAPTASGAATNGTAAAKGSAGVIKPLGPLAAVALGAAVLVL